MNHKIARFAIMLARLAGALALLLGIALWRGQSGYWVHAHMGLGVLLVLALWVLASCGFNVARGTAVLAIFWGLLMPALGLFQGALLPGEYHWLVQGAHLLVGLGAQALAERLAAVLRRGR